MSDFLPENWPPKLGPALKKITITATVIFLFPWLISNVAWFDAKTAAPLSTWTIYFFYYAIALFFLNRLTARLLTLPPWPNTEPVAKAELLAKIDAINQLHLPIAVMKTGPDCRLISWDFTRVPDHQLECIPPFRAMHQLEITVEAQGIVIAKDRRLQKKSYLNCHHGQVRFTPHLFFYFDLFPYSIGFIGGLTYRKGAWQVKPGYQFSLRLSEIKNPLIELICSSGWSYQPALA